MAVEPLRKPKAGVASPVAEAILVLARIAHSGAYLAIDRTQACPTSSFGVFLPRNDLARPMTLVSAEAVAQAKSLGWLASDTSGERLTLTRGGAEALRRSRSKSGVRARKTKSRAGARARAVAVASRAPAGSPLRWLSRRKDKGGEALISDVQLSAGERLSEDFWRAHMSPRVTADWSGLASDHGRRRSAPGAGVEMSDAMVAAQQRVRRALAAVGPELAGILIDVCCHEQGLEEAERALGWPQRSGKVVLQLALTRLARHYGLIAPEPPRDGRLRHWGAEDYRPNIDAWQ